MSSSIFSLSVDYRNPWEIFLINFSPKLRAADSFLARIENGAPNTFNSILRVHEIAKLDNCQGEAALASPAGLLLPWEVAASLLQGERQAFPET
jgi:hypothetical protein